MNITTRITRAQQTGFTLIELVTTIIIVGVLGSVSIPRMFDNQTFAQRGYIDELASSLRYAQKIAIASECEVTITLTAGNYVGMQRAACGGGAWNVPVSRVDGSLLSGAAPANIALNPATTIVFNARGGTNAAAPAINVGPFILTVNSVSGAVTVVP